MSMRIQDVLSSVCEGIKDFGSTAATWIGKTVQTTGTFISETLSKIAAFVKPHFEHLKTFAKDNQQSLLIAGVAFAVGAIATTVISQVFNRGANPTPAPVPPSV